MKAIIPVAGAGVNLRPHTYTQPKPLIPVAGKPIISFIIDQLKEAGVEDFVFVLGYLGYKIKDYLTKAYPELNKYYVYQENRLGLGHAIWLTHDYVKNDEEIVILLGDTILDMDMQKFLKLDGSVLGIQRVADPRLFGVVEVSKKGYVTRVIEKPKIPKSNLALVGLYKIADVRLLFKCLSLLYEESENQEADIHLADGLMMMVERDVHFSTYGVDHWYDCGRKEVLLETNQMLLQKRVSEVGTQYVYHNAIIIPPVIFGEKCSFHNAIIGPNVTLGDHVKIADTIISNSIIGDFVHVSSSVLTSSVIGNDAIIKGMPHSLNIGDNNEIDFTHR